MLLCQISDDFHARAITPLDPIQNNYQRRILCCALKQLAEALVHLLPEQGAIPFIQTRYRVPGGQLSHALSQMLCRGRSS